MAAWGSNRLTKETTMCEGLMAVLMCGSCKGTGKGKKRAQA